jgi:GT2 family glycosyltransferase
VPEISVLIATHNRRELLARCLEALGRQTLDPDRFEVIVADDGSADGSAAMAEALETPYRLRVLTPGKIGHAPTQNKALEAARAPVALLIDDDIIAAPELLAAHVAAHREDPRIIGIGALTQQPVDAHDWFAKAFAQGWNEHLVGLSERPTELTDCYGGNMSFPRQALLDLGGVSTALLYAYDFDIGFRLSQVGCRPVFIAAAQVVHDDQKRYPRIIEDAERSGRACLDLCQRHPQLQPELLDWRGPAGPRELALRRRAIGLGISPFLLAKLGWALPGKGRKMLWMHFIRRLAFWRGVKAEASDAHWQELSR